MSNQICFYVTQKKKLLQLNFDCFWRQLQTQQSIKENKKEFTNFFVAIVIHFKPILDKKNN